MSLPPEAAYDGEQLESLVGRFLDRTLPKPEWTHAAHVIVALWHVRQFGEKESLGLLRVRISAYNQSVGVMNTSTGGYHETITAFWTRIAGLLAARAQAGESFVALVGRSLPLCSDKNFPLRYYTKDRLFSSNARLHFLDPDLLPSPARASDLIN